MYRVYTSDHSTRVERRLYRVMGVDPSADQRWSTYLRSVLAFSLVGVLFLYAFLRLQHHLLFSLGFPGMEQSQAFNTAASFVTNTNWQSYSGESAVGYLVQMAGLAVQNFVSAAVGMSVVIALIRGFTRKATLNVGNFWVDLTRTCLRILLPLAVVAAIVLVVGGAIQNFHDTRTINTLVGAKQSITGGPVASQEAIKELGTNGGGFYNANSAHPFENPTGWTNWFEIFLLLVIPFSLPRTFGRMVGNASQGVVIVGGDGRHSRRQPCGQRRLPDGAPGHRPNRGRRGDRRYRDPLRRPAVGHLRDRYHCTSTGAVDSFHDSYTSIAGGTLILNMMFGEIAPGGIGSGLYGILILAVITVFVAGLMIGRTPEYLGKKIGAREMKFASLYILTTPVRRAGRDGGSPWPCPTSGPACSTPARTVCPRCCTRSRRPATTTGRRSPGSRSTPPGTTPRWGWRC